MSAPARLAVFVSGGGSNLQALIDHFNAGAHGAARVELVVASRTGIGALERASAAGVAAVVVERGEAETDRMQRELERHAIDWIVLAGYMRLVPQAVVRRFAGRMLNIHPALLPSFGGAGMYGRRVHEAVLAAGCTVSGATVHLVDEVYDRGRIVAQWPVPVHPDDTTETLAARVLRVEHRLLPAVVEALVTGGEIPAPFDAFAPAAARTPPADAIRSLIRRRAD